VYPLSTLCVYSVYSILGVFSVSPLFPWSFQPLHLPSASPVSLIVSLPAPALSHVSCHTPVSMSYTCFLPNILCHSFTCLWLDCCLFSVVLSFVSDPVCVDPACLPWTPILCLPLCGLFFFLCGNFWLIKEHLCVNLHWVLDSSAHEILHLATCDVRRDAWERWLIVLIVKVSLKQPKHNHNPWQHLYFFVVATSTLCLLAQMCVCVCCTLAWGEGRAISDAGGLLLIACSYTWWQI